MARLFENYWRINIDGRIYEGQYSSAANAAFGALLKDENHLYEEGKGSVTQFYGRSLIGLEKLDHKVARKVHRVWPTSQSEHTQS